MKTWEPMFYKNDAFSVKVWQVIIERGRVKKGNKRVFCFVSN